MTTFLLIFGVSIKIKDQQLKYVSSIQYPIKFKKGHTKIQALLDSGSEVDAITSVYATKLRLRIYSTNVRAQKIDGFTLSTYSIVLTNF